MIGKPEQHDTDILIIGSGGAGLFAQGLKGLNHADDRAEQTDKRRIVAHGAQNGQATFELILWV